MNQEQTYNNCKYFSRPKCTNKDDKLMDELIKAWKLIDGITDLRLDGNKISELGEKVNKQFCNPCDSFARK